jgi:hypothetical protein
MSSSISYVNDADEDGIFTFITPLEEEDEALDVNKQASILQPQWRRAFDLIRNNAPHWPCDGPEEVSSDRIRRTVVVVANDASWHKPLKDFECKTPFQLLRHHIEEGDYLTVSLLVNFFSLALITLSFFHSVL